MQTTYRREGSAHTVPLWFGWTDEAFEVVIAKGDVKLRHLAPTRRTRLQRSPIDRLKPA